MKNTFKRTLCLLTVSIMLGSSIPVDAMPVYNEVVSGDILDDSEAGHSMDENDAGVLFDTDESVDVEEITDSEADSESDNSRFASFEPDSSQSDSSDPDSSELDGAKTDEAETDDPDPTLSEDESVSFIPYGNPGSDNTITSNSTAGISGILPGSTSSYDSASKILTISLGADVVLEDTIIIKQGTVGDTICINLNNHTITGAAGVNGSDLDTATGKAAIQVESAQFNVKITGPGYVIGGKGAVYADSDSGYRWGTRGGDAVLFTYGDETYNPEKLVYGLTVSGGAYLTGGDGGDVTIEDLFANGVSNVDIMNGRLRCSGGMGGSGIGQVEERGSSAKPVYARYDIVNGIVSGGKGGDFYTQDFQFTRRNIRSNDSLMNYLYVSYPAEDIEDYFESMIYDRVNPKPGTGGYGIDYYCGRKYIYVGENSQVSGGTGGEIIYGETNYTSNRIYSLSGKGGIGIYICGDSGLTNAEPVLSTDPASADYWGKKSKNSDDIGIWVDGMVTGGDSRSVVARYNGTEYGGSAIHMEGDDWHAYLGNERPYDCGWGTIAVGHTGSVTGGTSGNTHWGDAGCGGEGIYEEEGEWGRMASCQTYLISGEVKGGNGGNALCGALNPDSQNEFTVSPAEISSPGEGGSGIGFDQRNRPGVTIAGNGRITSGACGYTSLRKVLFDPPSYYNNYWSDEYFYRSADAVDNLSEDQSTLDNGIATEAGALPRKIEMDPTGLSATITMDSFGYDDYHDKSLLSVTTGLYSSVVLPDGYDSDVYYDWRVVFSYTSSGMATYGTDRYECDLSSLANFKLGEAQMDFDKILDCSSLDGNNGNITTTIYCYVLLEDGRYTKSNEITFTNNGEGYSGGSTPGPGEIKVKGISLDHRSKTLYVGDTLELTATVTPDNAANKAVIFTSNKEEVAIVDEEGVVTAVSPGKATIRATAADGSGYCDECIVTVKAKLTNIYLEPENDGKVMAGAKIAIAATFNDDASTPLMWTTSDSSVASVSQTGVVTGKSEGTAQITATSTDSPDISATCEIIVTEPVTGISFNKKEVKLGPGESISGLIATALPVTAYDREVEYVSSDTSVVSILTEGEGDESHIVFDENGAITVIAGAKKGTAYIRATATDGSGTVGSCKVTVGNGVDTIAVTAKGTPAYLAAGKTLQLNTRFNRGDKKKQPVNKSVEWEIASATDITGEEITDDDESAKKAKIAGIATVSASGKVTAVSTGHIVVSATHIPSGKRAEYGLTIYTPMSSFKLNNSKLSLTCGKTYVFDTDNDPENDPDDRDAPVIRPVITPAHATVTDAGTVSETGQSIIWSIVKGDKDTEGNYLISLDPAEGTISTPSDLPAGKTKITATIRATAVSDSGKDAKITKTAECVVTVTREVKVSKVSVDKSKVSAGQGSIVILKPSISPFTADDVTYTVVSSNEAVVRVETNPDNTLKINEDGTVNLITGDVSGTATVTITASDGSLKKTTCKVTVGKPVAEVTIKGNDKVKRLIKGKKLSLKSYVYAAGKTKPANKKIRWSIDKVIDVDGNTVYSVQDSIGDLAVCSSYASINSKGKLTARKAGTIVVKAGSDEKPAIQDAVSSTCTIQIYVPVKKFAVSSKKRTVGEGKTGKIRITSVSPAAAADPANPDQKIRWTSSNENVIKIAAQADTLVSPEDESYAKSADIPAGSYIAYRACAPGKVTLTGTAKDGSKKKIKCVITVLGYMKEADVKLCVKSVPKTLKKTVKVTPGTGTSKAAKEIEVTGLKKGKSLTLTPVLTPGAHDKSVTFISSDPAIVSVSSKGVIKAKAPGTVTITMTTSDGGYTATCEVTAIR